MTVGPANCPAAVSTPVVALMLNTEIVIPASTYRNLPDGCTAISAAPPLTGKGDPGTGVSAPVVGLTLNPEIVLALTFGVYRNVPFGVRNKSCGLLPVLANPIVVSTPVVVLTENTWTLFVLGTFVKANLPVGANFSVPPPELNGEPVIGVTSPVDPIA